MNQLDLFSFDEDERLARRLEETGRYRILRKLHPRPVIARADSLAPRLAIIIDTETTGLRHDRDEVIEVGAVAFTYDDAGTIGDVVGVFQGLSEPQAPLPPEIVSLTGITDAMLAGQRIDLAALEAFAAPADLVIAHNAAFDRRFCEGLARSFAFKAWACSHAEIAWRELGFEGSKLSYLLSGCGLFHDGHRAVDDCHALLEILDHTLPTGGGTPFARLLTASARTRRRIYAEHAPFDLKDLLKQRGYRWSDGSDGRPRAWWVEVDETDAEAELAFLRGEIYRHPAADPLIQTLTALDRFKSA
ncbi:3'-5' exonuclease [Aureimonas frigidaquae]|uniref:DNA polymerase III epsilon subunit-like 3'-5'exonuclease n=1 Tax=Aureimonas frigidaquae TaxID=424757 RepID=A0A0P0Z3Y5_9HYPH|nr:3'-5' exonuclease [Aureimonas frigidaquae]BAT28524.1 DNA polymerase III epsilon subunit-like 3'-5'exonuclease [Aureimonas frigidaquae]